MTHEFEALGTRWWITIFNQASSQTLEGAAASLERLAREYESRYSRFRPDSLISQLNDQRRLMKPDQELCDLLQYGAELYARTDGRFNLLTGHILEARGYDADYSFQDRGGEVLLPGDPLTDLNITADEVRVTYGRVDIGGFGKGYLIDLLAQKLEHEFGLDSFLINGGGDMYATHEEGAPVKIYLEHPTEPGQAIATTTLYQQGFAASAPFKRTWKSGGKTHTHIVSDVAVEPAATFVKAKSAGEADAFATAALLFSTEALLAIAQREAFSVAL